MPKSYLVVDGYNLLYELTHQWGVVLKQENLEEYRDKLISLLADYAALSGHKTVLVFDALHRDSKLSEEELSGITVVYTGKDETADTYIERYLYSRPRRSLVILVTSDASVQEMALLTGAQRYSSRQFIQEMENIKKDHAHFATRFKHKEINVLGEHLQDDALSKFERLRYGKGLDDEE